jgi:hypothetical protein
MTVVVVVVVVMMMMMVMMMMITIFARNLERANYFLQFCSYFTSLDRMITLLPNQSAIFAF